MEHTNKQRKAGNKMANDFLEKVKANAPGIMTAGSIVSCICASALGMYEGWKLKEDFDKLPEDATGKDKGLLILRRTLPVALACGTSCGLSYASYAESMNRIAALSAAYAAAKLDNEELKKFKNKAKEMLGEEHSDILEGEIIDENAQTTAKNIGLENWDQVMTMHDKTTGFVMTTTLRDYFSALNEYNKVAEVEDQPISYFYEQARTDGVAYTEIEPLYDSIYTVDGHLHPTPGLEFGPDMKPVFTIKWDEQMADMPGKRKKARNQCIENYSF